MSDINRDIENIGKVTLVDPNLIAAEGSPHTHPIPDYENMHIFVELTVERRGRSVFKIDSGGVIIDDEHQNSDVKINLMGSDQNENSPNKNKFTSNWHNIDTGEDIQYETFGITSIDIQTNTSYIPQINIQFTDIRGHSFFNNDNSPYRALFDFPPPVFRLKVKGYYGKTLTYVMHLVKYNSEFNSDNGNFVIDANFIGITYAPLTDIPFKYVLNFPLIREKRLQPQVDVNRRPQNTMEFLLSLESLYSQKSEFLKTTRENEEYEKSVERIGKYERILNSLNRYRSDAYLKEEGKALLFVLDNNVEENQPLDYLRKVKSFNDFNGYIENLGTKGRFLPPQRLYLGYYVGNVEVPTFDFNKKQNTLINFARNFTENHLTDEGLEISQTPFNLRADVDLSGDSAVISPNSQYMVIDVTEFYIEFFKKWETQKKRKNTLATTLNTKINNMIIQKLRMKPTIYNIFKLILDDVDKVFKEIGQTSIRADELHNTHQDQIINNPQYKDVNNKIYPFPLFIDQQNINGCDVQEVRVSPRIIEEEINYNFPEMDLVDNFIDTFKDETQRRELMRKKEESDGDGNNIWIPLNPLDSSMLSDAASPYTNALFMGEGAINSIFITLLNRFYIFSQNVFPSLFDQPIEGTNQLLNVYAEAEASNLAESVLNSEVLETLINHSRIYKNNIDRFYEYLSGNVSIYEEDIPTAKLSYLSDIPIYKTRTNNNFRGLSLYSGDISIREDIIDGEGPVIDYLNSFQPGRLKGILEWWFGRVGSLLYNSLNPQSGLDYARRFFDLTEENIFYLTDPRNYIYDIKERYDDFSRYLYNDIFITRNGDDIEINNQIFDYDELLDDIKNYGYEKLYQDNIIDEDLKDKFQEGGHISHIYSDVIGRSLTEENEFYVSLLESNDTQDKLFSALLISSSFGSINGVFGNRYNDIFSTPQIIEIPICMVYYYGALVRIIENDWVDDLIEYFKNGPGRYLTDSHNMVFRLDPQPVQYGLINIPPDKPNLSILRIVADIHSVNNFLSEQDKIILKEEFNIFYDQGSDFDSIRVRLKKLVDERMGELAIRQFYFFENPYYKEILNILRRPINLMVFSERTFNRENPDPTEETFTSLESFLNESGERENNTNNFFRKFFSTLLSKLKTKENLIEQKENEFYKRIGDEDIYTNTYYSFKNIHDKWLVGLKDDKATNGYPFNIRSHASGETALINSFAFVDRTMNPIGNTIIDPEILLDLMNDFEVSVYTVLSQILSLNNFEFFPLQNFMTHQQDDWKKSFKIDSSGEQKTQPAFVCMYIGGSSNYPSNINSYSRNQFKDDTIIDLSNNDLSDFNDGDCYNVNEEEDGQIITNNTFPWRKVRAFRVRFGEQSQSMFKDISIEGNDFPETNESLQILSRIAGDNKQQAPIPKGQNLYDLYENRAYSTTINGLGNIMIQPSQYFQLENIPMFNGAYIILNVEHSIRPNHMTTKFSGTKLLKYPVPKVKEPSAIFGFEGGKSDITSSEVDFDGEIKPAYNVDDISEKAKIKGMNELRIQ